MVNIFEQSPEGCVQVQAQLRVLNDVRRRVWYKLLEINPPLFTIQLSWMDVYWSSITLRNSVISGHHLRSNLSRTHICSISRI